MFHDGPWVAWAIVLLLMGIGAMMEFWAGRVWPGPIYLAAITISAWALDSRIAWTIAPLVIMLKVLANYLGVQSQHPVPTLADILLRAMAVLVVIGIIGHARRCCEREWNRSRTDPLTGALNRQAFFDIVEHNHGAEGWTALVYADLDGLKRLNDTEGHDRGDESLRFFADHVRKTIRKQDIFARLGGDEFIIFMRVKNQDGGWAAAERLRNAINVDGPKNSIHLKCSFGVLLLPDGVNSIDQELKAADDLMYHAKREGLGLAVSMGIPGNEKIAVLPLHSQPHATKRKSAVRKREIA